jgi:hypothetical protein
MSIHIASQNSNSQASGWFSFVTLLSVIAFGMTYFAVMNVAHFLIAQQMTPTIIEQFPNAVDFQLSFLRTCIALLCVAFPILLASLATSEYLMKK